MYKFSIILISLNIACTGSNMLHNSQLISKSSDTDKLQKEAEKIRKKTRILNNVDSSLGSATGMSFLQTFMLEFKKEEMSDFDGIGSVIATVDIDKSSKITSIITEGPNKKFNKLVEKTLYIVNDKYRLPNSKLNENQRITLPITIQF